MVKDIKIEQNFFENVFQSQNNIILLTDFDTKKIVYANTFFELFFDMYLSQFKEKYDCICETFVKEDTFLLKSWEKGKYWIEYVISNIKTRAMIYDSQGKKNYFDISIKHYKDSLYIVFFIQITPLEIERQKIIKEKTMLKQYKNAVDSSSIFSKTNPSGIIKEVNEQFCILSGYKREELIGKPHNIVRHPDMSKEEFKEMWDTIKKGKVWKGEVKNMRKDGGVYWVAATIIPIFDKEGEIFEYISIRNDITELEIYKEKLEKNVSTREVELQKKINENEHQWKLIDNNIIFSKTDTKGNILYASKAFIEISGYSMKELIHKPHNIVRHPDMPKEIFKEMWDTIKNGMCWSGEIKNRKKDGGYYWVLAKVSPDFDNNNNIISYSAVRHDITAKKDLEIISITDPLTKLYNRRHFNEKLDFFEGYDYSINNEKIMFFMFDIDFFKKYNDTYGHKMGDIVLEKVAKQMKEFFSKYTEFIYRLGGEEFGAIILIKNNEETKWIKKIKKFVSSIEKIGIEHKNNEVSKYLTISLGGVLTNKKEVLKTIYESSDEFLYEAKHNGKNQSIVKTL